MFVYVEHILFIKLDKVAFLVGTGMVRLINGYQLRYADFHVAVSRVPGWKTAANQSTGLDLFDLCLIIILQATATTDPWVTDTVNY